MEEINRSEVLLSKFRNHGNIHKFADLARKVGYKYFEWNGRIYKRSIDGGVKDTGKTLK